MNKFFLFDTKDLKFKNLKKDDNPLRIYVCGITPYDYSHIGHARCYLVYDILIRSLRYFKFNYLYCRNITDIDDKIINKAKLEFDDPRKFNEISERYYKSFKDDLAKLNCIEPNFEPKVSETIEEIINFIEKLIKKGFAYELDGSVYFSVDEYKNYGTLSKRKLEEQNFGERVSINEKKRNPMDFALWKKSEDVFWKSPWGNGRPGWHIECSAIAKKFLGEEIDIHGGGMDLIFPHHENEMAQSECCNEKEFVKIWTHIAFVCVNKEKMSKSYNNFFTIKDVLEKFDPMVFRYYLLQNSYSTPFNFSFDDLENCEKSFKKIVNFFEKTESKVFEKKGKFLIDLEDSIFENLNTAKTLGIIHKFINENNENSEKDSAEIKYFIENVLGLVLKKIEKKKDSYSKEILSLIEERENARREKNFKRADEIREILKKMNIDINDKKI